MGGSLGAGVGLATALIIDRPLCAPREECAIGIYASSTVLGVGMGLYLGATDAAEVRGAVDGAFLGSAIGVAASRLWVLLRDPGRNSLQFLVSGGALGLTAGALVGAVLADRDNGVNYPAYQRVPIALQVRF